MTGLPRPVVDALGAAIYGDRALAYLRINPDFTVSGAGGALDNYGLDAIPIGESVFERAFFLEGVLPLAEAPYFVPSLELAHGRCADLHFFLDAGSTWLVLLDVTAERDRAQRMQQKAYSMTLLEEREEELNRQLEATNEHLRTTQRELLASREAVMLAHERLHLELADAARYVRSLLPQPLREPLGADWLFVPCAELGGDAFGYHWIDPDNFAFYLLDVCGHGVGPCLVSVGVLHVLQSESLRDVDFCVPEQVLEALNKRYQMANPEDLFFTLWYGVYHPRTRQLEYSSAGHPPAILLEADGARLTPLTVRSPPIGCAPRAAYKRATLTVPVGSQLYLVSDGAYEITGPDGMLTFEEFLDILHDVAATHPMDLDRLFERLTRLRGVEALEDDCSIVRLAF
jgi:serine phosphatase RsbU (regulator of sigma subunit)